MRVSIEHREEAAGFLGGHKNHYVDFGVEFSEEEKAIIKARDLRDKFFEISTSKPIPTAVGWYGVNIIGFIGRVALVVGLVAAFFTSWGGPLFFVGAAVSIFHWVKMRQQNKAVDNREQRIRIRDLLSQRKFTAHATDPSHARQLDEEIKDRLAGVKQLLIDGAETRAKATFEL